MYVCVYIVQFLCQPCVLSDHIIITPQQLSLEGVERGRERERERLRKESRLMYDRWRAIIMFLVMRET